MALKPEYEERSSGTGIFEGATGHLFFTGTGTASFDSVASGEICLAR